MLKLYWLKYTYMSVEILSIAKRVNFYNRFTCFAFILVKF